MKYHDDNNNNKTKAIMCLHVVVVVFARTHKPHALMLYWIMKFGYFGTIHSMTHLKSKKLVIGIEIKSQLKWVAKISQPTSLDTTL